MTGLDSKQILVSLVTLNEEPFIENCLASLMEQTLRPRVVIFDNASSDRTVEIARKFPVEIRQSEQNIGYSAGHNQILLSEGAEYCVLLNSDLRLDGDFIERLVDLMERSPEVGIAGGKLFRMDASGGIARNSEGCLLDSTGMYITPVQRHFDRGSGEVDRGQYDRRQAVFGITGAAVVYRRAMLEEVRFEDEYLDEDFFAYREDADLAWRARIAGWEVVYEPRAVGRHHRFVLPRGRRKLNPRINYHSVKNRFLMRAKNMDRSVLWKCLPYLWIRDAGILSYVLLSEHSSLPALKEVWRLRRRSAKKRCAVEASRKVSPDEMARWFSFTPVARDWE